MIAKTRLLIVLLIFFAVIAVTACVSQTEPAPSVPPSPSAIASAPSLTTVRVGYVPLVSNAPLFIAKEEGYFARQGIDVEFIKLQSGAAMIPPLVNGDIAVGGGAVSAALINAISKGAQVRIVADKGRNSPGHSCNASGLLVRRDLYESGAVTRAADLKGRKIMTPADQDYKIFRILKMGNLTSGDISVFTMDFASGVLALKNGAVDAADLTEPYVTYALDSNAAVMLLPTEECSPDFPTPLYYGSPFLEKDRDLGRSFMVAYLEGVRRYNLGKTERNIEIISNYTRLDHDVLKRSCWLPIDPSGDLPRKPVRDYMDWMEANGKISRSVTDDQLFDMSFVDYANGVLGNKSNNG